MRVLGRILAGLVLLLAGLPLLRMVSDITLPQIGPMPQDEQLKQASAALVYRLRRDTWLSFEIPASGEPLFRVLTNAEAPVDSDDDTAPWPYAIEYRLLDAQGKVLEQRRYYHRTRFSRADARHRPQAGAQTPSEAAPRAPAFYLDEKDIAPADGRVMLLRTQEFPEASRIQLRLYHTTAPLEGAVLRLYQRERIPEHKLAHRWNRVSEQRKERLARGNVYGKEWLTPEEQRALLRYRWVPLAPQGITGDDDLRRVLYVLDDPDTPLPSGRNILPDGLLVEPGHNGTIPVPPGGGRLQLALQFIDGHSRGELWLRWRGESDRSRFARHFSFEDLATKAERNTLPLPGAGLIDLSSDRPVIVTARLESSGHGPMDITPQPAFLRAWKAGPGMSVDFPVEHIGRRRTPLRIDYRRFMHTPGLRPLTLHYQLIGTDGKPGYKAACRGEADSSRYDRLYGSPLEYPLVSDALHCHLNVAANVERVRVWLSDPGLVHAYSTPPDLPPRTRVPADYYSWDPQQQRLPGWYGLAPADEERLLRELRMQRLVWQRRPAEDDPEVLAGHYLWEEFHPRGAWRARFLLNPRDTQLPLPDDALAAVFHEFRAGADVPVTLVASGGRRLAAPRVIFQRDRAGPVRIQVLLDGEPVLESEIRGRRGQLRLRDLPPGRHRLRIRAPAGIRWFINQVRAEAPAHVRRLAVRIGPRAQAFVYHKRQSEELLTGQLHLPTGYHSPVWLRVRIQGSRRGGIIGSAGWTFLERRFRITPADGRVPVLNTRDQWVDKGRRFHIPLRDDLPAGDYRIEVWLEDSEGPAYLSLYRLTPGLHEKRRLFRERGRPLAERQP
ncbi:MAG TPA: hypothetical protein ENJ79_04165 [Gammaproteobacteria bacterium]|nr:hypothetical protein [Gammaproteobacteria bacterium]